MITIELTGNEARCIFFSLKNKRSTQAQSVREKLMRASEKNFLKDERKAFNQAQTIHGSSQQIEASRVRTSPKIV